MIAFVFPGQGAQKVGMGRALAERFPECRAVFDAADAALGEPLSQLCFEGPDERLVLTENTQPAILAVSLAAHARLAALGIVASFVAGHSLGEYSANVAAGTLAFGDALRVVRRRGQFMQEAVPVGAGAMAAVLGLSADAVEQACREAAEGDVVSPANINGAGQVVIAGSAAAVGGVRKETPPRALGAKRVIPLNVSAPFHCALMQPAEARLAPELRALSVADPRVPVVVNVDATPRTTAAGAIEALVQQVSRPVRWEDVVDRLASEGVRTYVEVGPGTVLSGLIRKIDRTATVYSTDQDLDSPALLALATAS